MKYTAVAIGEKKMEPWMNGAEKAYAVKQNGTMEGWKRERSAYGWKEDELSKAVNKK